MLLNNAGVCPNVKKRDNHASGDTERLQQTEIFSVNFHAAVRLTTALLPLLRKMPAGAARVMNISFGDGKLVFFAMTFVKSYNVWGTRANRLMSWRMASAC